MEDNAMLTEANDLYWRSELSVNQIAERLDLSKGKLYGAIVPQPTGLLCPECATEADYPNRTAKDKGQVLCASCGFEGHVDDLVHPTDDAWDEFGDQVGHAAGEGWHPPPSRIFWGSVLLGAAAGIVLFRRRRRS